MWGERGLGELFKTSEIRLLDPRGVGATLPSAFREAEKQTSSGSGRPRGPGGIIDK